jgi:hypothetical protein
MKKPAILITAMIIISAIAAKIHSTDYYLSPRGSDVSPGSRQKPFQTIERLNQIDLEPGDRVLFEGESSYSGTITLDLDDSGEADRPVILTSFGTGRAVIDGGAEQGLVFENCAFVLAQDLSIHGLGRKSGNSANGIEILHAQNIIVSRIEVSGFQHAGIHISGSQHIKLTGIHAHDNGAAGINSSDDMSADIYVTHCLAENNPGDPTILDNHSGNGIVIGRVKKALIEYCEASYNGWDMPRIGNGPVGIWTWDSDSVVIQHCVSHHNRSTGIDGGGFDLDGGATHAILQYNYSHNNHGAGYLLCQYPGAPRFADNIVRYNISQDDGLTNHNAGIFVYVGDSLMMNTDVYNNTIYNSKGAAVAFGIGEYYKGPLPQMTFRNNIFVSGGAQIQGPYDMARFEGNLYWAMGDGGFVVDEYTDFEQWAKATGQEMIDGNIVGHYADPLLNKTGQWLITDPMQLRQLQAYRLQAQSPAIDAGLDLKKLFQLDPGKMDFYGNAIPANRRFDVGACEF